MTKHLNRDVVALPSQNNKPTKKGFTLTEMLVVVMVIAVLAAIAYPLYTKAATKSRAIEAINLLEMVRNKQLQKYAEDRVYYSSFTNMGQLTANKRQETLSAQELKIKDYTLSLNNVHSCMTATYEKGNTTFSFSSSYEQTGLGCTGDVCSSFGDIVGTAKDVCNCGSKSCSNGYTLNEDTCNCDCYLGCDQSGTCFAPYGGGLTRYRLRNTKQHKQLRRIGMERELLEPKPNTAHKPNLR